MISQKLENVEESAINSAPYISLSLQAVLTFWHWRKVSLCKLAGSLSSLAWFVLEDLL